jgi:thiol-disulfide isomerase/thioredoxin
MVTRWHVVAVVLLAGCRDASVPELPQGQLVIDAEIARQVTEQLAGFEPFDFDFNLASVDDQMVALQDYRGKVVIVDFWGTSHGPCRAALPHLGDIYQKYRERGLEVIGINYERGDRSTWSPLIKEFVEKNSLPYTCLLGDEATKRQVPQFTSFPTTLFIDAAGKVRYKTVGVRPYSEGEAIVEVLINEREAPQRDNPDGGDDLASPRRS